MINTIKNKFISLLRKSEKWTKTDMVYLAHGGFWLLSSQFISSLSSFLLSILFANLISVELYGAYQYILSVAGILSITTLSGMGTSIVQAVSRGYSGTMYAAFKTQIKWGLIGGILGLIVGAYYWITGNTTLAAGFFITSIFIPFMDPLYSYAATLGGQKQFKKSNIYNLITKIFTLTLIALVLFFSQNILLLIFTYFASNTLMRLTFFRITLRNIDQKKVDPGALTYGKHLSLLKGLNTGIGYLNNILMFNVFGSAMLSISSFAMAPLNQIRSAIKVSESLLMPKASRDEWKINNRILIRKLIYAALITTAIVFIYIIIAPIYYRLLLPQYVQAIKYSQILSLSLILTTIYIILYGIVTAKAMIRHVYQMTIINSALNFIIVLPLLYFFGLMGWVLGLIASRLIEVIILCYIIFISSHKLIKNGNEIPSDSN